MTPDSTKACGCGPLEPCLAHLVLPGDLPDWEARARAAEAKLAALEAALRRHMPLLDERGTPLCGGCLEPAPCPDAGLIAEEPSP